jgi:branched-subunit amino acid transport protein
VSAATIWALIGISAVVTAAIKGAGPFALGGRDLPDWFSRVITFMAPALLAALVCTATLANGDKLAVGADTAGVAVAGVLLWRGASVMVGVAVAAVVTALLRAV